MDDLVNALAVLEQFDGFARLRNGLRRLASDREEWAGIPMPLADSPLVIEPRYPKAKELMEIGRAKPPAKKSDLDDAKVRNRFYSTKRSGDIVVFENEGRIDWGIHHNIHSADHLISTLNAQEAWGIEQESRAIDLLGKLLRHRQFKAYLLTGMFMERSKRSGVFYLFRRLRPTIAISSVNNKLRILAGLCLHPIGYYEGSWAGAMCPTDDVVAHLMLMRGDEHMFWKRANQHPPYRKEVGL